MRECPSCQSALPPGARFCTRCGERLTATAEATLDEWDEPTLNWHIQPPADDPGAEETVIQSLPTDFLQQARPTNGAFGLEEQADLPLLESQEEHPDPTNLYARKKRELEAQCFAIATSMKSLLPFVYENHRDENQALFANCLRSNVSLEDPVWGHVAFVLGAYGNYMYRYPLGTEQKQQVWRALLWAVYYERCYRRKYLAQRCQQLFHFFQGCVKDQIFLDYALPDLDDLHTHLEAGSLKKLEEILQQMPQPPASLLARVSAQIIVAHKKKQMQQYAVPNKTKKVPSARKVSRAVQQASAHDEVFLVKALPESQSESEPALIPRKQWGEQIGENLSLAPGARKMLSFFTEEQCQEFLACLRLARLESVNLMLQSMRQPLCAALLQELITPALYVYQEPRRPIRLGRKTADRFSEARRLLNSTRENEQQIGLRLFEQGARETTHPDYILLAREWMFYARAITQGAHRVVNDWESYLQSEDASWEEIWNLAVFYQQTGYPIEALRVLNGGIVAGKAPFAHLCFALVCALNLLEPGRYNLLAQQRGSAFLLAYLEQWPHPLSCLVWLVLAQEVHGPLHPRQQSQQLSAFQELLDHPVSLPDPQKELPDTKITALEELLAKVGCSRAWLLWISDYAERHPRKYQAWSRLAEISERLGNLEAAEHSLQHLVELQYHHDYAHYQEGKPLPRAEYLRRNLEKLFDFYQRYNLTNYAADAFHSCYPALCHLWETRDPANRKLIALTRPYLEQRQQQDAQTLSLRRENVTRELSQTITAPLEPLQTDKRVGIFVDYENIAHFIPREMDIEAVGQALVSYALQFGTVVCQWASASPHNLSNLADVRGGLEAASFKVRFPRRELQFSNSKKNLADFALLECLSEAATNERPDVYLIVSGDRDYYERICSLLDTGHTVHVLAAANGQHLSLKYRELEQQRARERQTAGQEFVDFFIDDLAEIIYPLVPIR